MQQHIGKGLFNSFFFVWYNCQKLLLGSLLKIALQLKIIGASNTKSVPAIYVMNHIHRLDTIIVIACLPGITRLIMARDVITNHPILSLLVRIVGRSGGAIVVDRHKINNNFSIRQAVVALKNGQNILIAPEGTRNTSEELGHFYDGVSFLALSTGVPIIPVATWGYKKQNILEMIREKEVNISFGEPLHFNKKIFSSKEDRRIITEIVRSKINLLLHESKNLSSFSQKEGTEIK